ncbi:hypothetical protein [Halorientalis persicus]|uniref:hypothetical protein n=1 Tax=Halorientalis persicus TaxID=1367881 RepID=UPI000B84942B|nr:hypothetical protein [Halorientalis persicus]
MDRHIDVGRIELGRVNTPDTDTVVDLDKGNCVAVARLTLFERVADVPEDTASIGIVRDAVVFDADEGRITLCSIADLELDVLTAGNFLTSSTA